MIDVVTMLCIVVVVVIMITRHQLLHDFIVRHFPIMMILILRRLFWMLAWLLWSNHIFPSLVLLLLLVNTAHVAFGALGIQHGWSSVARTKAKQD
jgi:hypothetical protein